MKIKMIKAGLLALTASAIGSLPQLVRADNECGPGPVATCSGAQPAGVTYTSAVDFSLTAQTGFINAGTVGFNITGTGGANLTFTQAGNITGTGGIDLVTDSGNINAVLLGSAGATPGGLRAVSSSGSIDITIGASNTALSGGLLADTSAGAGHTTMNLSRGVSGSGVRMINGSGNFEINLHDNNPTNAPFSAFFPQIAVLTTSGGGNGTINIGEDTALNRLDASPDAGATITVNNDARLGGDESSVWGTGSGAGSITVHNRERLRGAMNFSVATGAITIINDSEKARGNVDQAGWWFGGASVLGSGDDRIVNTSRGVMAAAAGPFGLNPGSIDFGAGDDVFVNEGRFIVGRRLSVQQNFYPPGTVTLSNLERFENSGSIQFGVVYQSAADTALNNDGIPGTRLVAHGVHFVGSGNSRLVIDAELTGTVQADCSVSIAADCADFTGGSTEGVTLVTVNDGKPAVANAAFNEGIVLVEGASAAEHFQLDPASRGYAQNSSAGAAIQKGLVAYRFIYDADMKQHKLTGVLADEGAQGGTFMASAQEIWRTTTDTWFDRQAALRAKPTQGGSESGLWSTVNMSTGERDFVAANAIGANTYDYNLKQDQQITHLAFGGDFINDGGLSFGGMAGYVYSTIDYDATKLQSEIGGFQAGLYGSYLMGPLSVDALINYNLATQTLDAKNLGLGPDTQIRTDLTSIGGRVDAGYRLSFGDAFYLQPLVGAAYVTTTIDDLELPSNGGSFEFDGTSFRAGVGLRMGIALPTGGLKTSLDLTGRWWNEMEGQNDTVVTIPNGNTEVPLTDEFDGGFSEVAAGIQLAGPDSVGFSGFINVKSKFASEYRTLGASAGFRYQW